MGQPRFECGCCGRRFSTHRLRQDHIAQCTSDIFRDEFLDTTAPPEKPVPTYRELIEKRAQIDPYYQRYIGRVNISEPNNMGHVIKEIYNHEREARKRAKEKAQGVRRRPKESK